MADIKKNTTFDNFWKNIEDKADQSRRDGSTPLIIIDLDGTLVDYSMRTYSIFQEIPSKIDLSDDIREKVLSIKPSEFYYHPKDNLVELGVDGNGIADKIKKFWENQFLSNYFLHYDIPIDGGLEFLKNILSLNINIVYLTGRDEQNMGRGTRAWLQKYELHPIENRTRLLLKTDLSLINYESKAKNCEIIKTLGSPVLVLDNEPKELATIWEIFPEAIGVLMETQNTGRKATLPERTLRMCDFVKVNSLFEN